MLLTVTFNRRQSESRGLLWYNQSMPTPTMLDVKLFIRNLNVEQLAELSESIEGRRTVLDGQAALTYPRGASISFDSGRRGIIYGTIEEWKRGGKANVRSSTGSAWSVRGSLLKPGR